MVEPSSKLFTENVQRVFLVTTNSPLEPVVPVSPLVHLYCKPATSLSTKVAVTFPSGVGGVTLPPLLLESEESPPHPVRAKVVGIRTASKVFENRISHPLRLKVKKSAYDTL
ncbi:hypothetical protein CTT37_11505 [Photobacterium damselae]|nr:hypothetical protein CTT37_11505 [Photobacterium damselae]